MPSRLRRSPRKRNGSNSNTKPRVIAALQPHDEGTSYRAVVNPRRSPFGKNQQPNKQQQQQQNKQQQQQQQQQVPSLSCSNSNSNTNSNSDNNNTASSTVEIAIIEQSMMTMMTMKENVRMIEAVTLPSSTKTMEGYSGVIINDDKMILQQLQQQQQQPPLPPPDPSFISPGTKLAATTTDVVATVAMGSPPRSTLCRTTMSRLSSMTLTQTKTPSSILRRKCTPAKKDGTTRELFAVEATSDQHFDRLVAFTSSSNNNNNVSFSSSSSPTKWKTEAASTNTRKITMDLETLHERLHELFPQKFSATTASNAGEGEEIYQSQPQRTSKRLFQQQQQQHNSTSNEESTPLPCILPRLIGCYTMYRDQQNQQYYNEKSRPATSTIDVIAGIAPIYNLLQKLVHLEWTVLEGHEHQEELDQNRKSQRRVQFAAIADTASIIRTFSFIVIIVIIDCSIIAISTVEEAVLLLSLLLLVLLLLLLHDNDGTCCCCVGSRRGSDPKAVPSFQSIGLKMTMMMELLCQERKREQYNDDLLLLLFSFQYTYQWRHGAFGLLLLLLLLLLFYWERKRKQAIP